NTLINEMNSIATTTRLTELQIVMIFEQIVAGVVYMHTQEPPIQHRDLKVENIFHAQDGKYKIGDFGSCTIKEMNPETMTQNQIVVLEEQIQKKTTPCYRSPEMTDLYLKQKIGLPCDVWALGCILYTMCFYENPFERGGNLSIMNVAYTYPTQDEWIRSERERLKGKGPGREMYSKDILALIDFMLEPDVDSRPTILQVLSRTNEMLGKPYPRNLPQPPPPPKPTITQKHVLLFEQEEKQKKSRARRQLPPELTQEDLERISQKRKSGDKRQHIESPKMDNLGFSNQKNSSSPNINQNQKKSKKQQISPELSIHSNSSDKLNKSSSQSFLKSPSVSSLQSPSSSLASSTASKQESSTATMPSTSFFDFGVAPLAEKQPDLIQPMTQTAPNSNSQTNQPQFDMFNAIFTSNKRQIQRQGIQNPGNVGANINWDQISKEKTPGHHSPSNSPGTSVRSVQTQLPNQQQPGQQSNTNDPSQYTYFM
ncbi:MAG: putative NAK/BIKE protein kinase, partial [Streblomastix strix]